MNIYMRNILVCWFVYQLKFSKQNQIIENQVWDDSEKIMSSVNMVMPNDPDQKKAATIFTRTDGFIGFLYGQKPSMTISDSYHFTFHKLTSLGGIITRQNESIIFKYVVKLPGPELEDDPKNIPKKKIKTLAEIDQQKEADKQPKMVEVYQMDWVGFYFEDFEQYTNYWRENNFNLVKCDPDFDENILQHDCNSDVNEVFFSVNILPHHSEIKVNLSFHFIDAWNGEQAWVKIDDKLVWTDTYEWCNIPWLNNCQKRGQNACGNKNYPDNMGQLVSFTKLHTEQELKITVGTSIEKGNCDAQWGIDNIEVFYRTDVDDLNQVLE